MANLTILDENDKTYLENRIDALHSKQTASLTVADWSDSSQTVTVTGVTASNTVFVAPAPASQDAYTAAGIKCTTQGANLLTFSCKTTPTEAIDVNVVILGV